MNLRNAALLLAFAAVTALAGCGGGGLAPSANTLPLASSSADGTLPPYASGTGTAAPNVIAADGTLPPYTASGSSTADGTLPPY